MASRIHPLQRNDKNGEVFLKLRDHPNIILTPARPTDVDGPVAILNDPKVYSWLSGPPHPYLPEHAISWFGTRLEESKATIKQLEDSTTDTELVVGGCPVHILREVHEDGSDTFIGDISIIRCSLMELTGEWPNVDWDNKKALDEANAKRPVGDPEIVWTIGNYLSPTHHGQGIMSDAVRTLIYDWAIPRMHVRRLLVTAFEGNEGSLKVFKKYGFVQRPGIVKDHIKGFDGEPRSQHVLDWAYNI